MEMMDKDRDEPGTKMPYIGQTSLFSTKIEVQFGFGFFKSSLVIDY